MELEEYAACDATALARLIAEGQVATAEVHEAALRAIAAVDPQLNAVVRGPFEGAPYDAEGPFAGVPFAIKDTLWEAGRPVEFGSRLLVGHVARRDATLAQRFRAAGLPGVVRSATPELGFCADTAPLVHGPTRNPWDTQRSPGGSSGGSGALVAARALPMAHANDGAGSIRIPAAWCGLVGLKPSRGRVPGGPMIGEAPGGIAHEFAVTRTVRDAALLLDAVCGPAPGDRYYVARPARPYAEQLAAQVEPLRIALAPDPPWGMPPAPDVRAAVEEVALSLEELGHHVEPATPAVHAERMRRAGLVFWSLMLAGVATALSRQLERPVDETTLEPATLAFVRRGCELAGLEVSRAEAAFNANGRAWGSFLDEYDVLMSPTLPTTAPPSGWAGQDSTPDAESYEQRLFDRIPYTPVANATGQPSISLPLATGADGLPIGVMFTAQTLREDLLLRLAAQLEDAVPWADRRPAVCVG